MDQSVQTRRPTAQDLEDLPGLWESLDLAGRLALTMPGMNRRFSALLPGSDSYVWGLVWCATDETILAENLDSISLTYSVDGNAIPADRILEFDRGDGPPAWSCHFWTTVVEDWSALSSVKLEAGYRLAGDIFDGRCWYRQGAYDYTLRVDVGNPLASSGTPAASLDSDLEAARRALKEFFGAIQAEAYETAAGLYGGGSETLASLVATMSDMYGQPPTCFPPSSDVGGVLEAACRDGFLCLPLRRIVSERLASDDEFEFVVELTDPGTGEPFVFGPCCGASETEMPPVSEFTYRVVRGADGQFRVLWTPIYTP